MWSIANLKNRGKTAMKRNYWKVFLICLVLCVIGEAPGISTALSSYFQAIVRVGDSSKKTTSNPDFRNEHRMSHRHSNVKRTTLDYDELDDFDSFFGSFDREYGEASPFSGGRSFEARDRYDNRIGELFSQLRPYIVFIMLVCILAIAFALAIHILVYRPISVGCRRFLMKNQEENAKISELAFPFDNNYLNVVKVMFFRDLYTFLWTLLFIIPGIIKNYEYRMVPYLLAENPNISKEEAFAVSKRLMDGDKLHAFLLDLSFIGWHILGAFSIGLVDVFYTNPYEASTDATLFEALKYLKFGPGAGMDQTGGMPSAPSAPDPFADPYTAARQADPFTAGPATQGQADPFMAGQATQGQAADPFTAGQSVQMPAADPFTAGQAAQGQASDPFMTGQATQRQAADPFTAGQAAQGQAADPFMARQAAQGQTADPFTAGQPAQMPPASPFAAGQTAQTTEQNTASSNTAGTAVDDDAFEEE